MWLKISKKIDPNTGASKKRLKNKFSKIKIDGKTRDPKYLITNLKLLRGHLLKFNVGIDKILG